MSTESAAEDPDYISFLFSSKLKYDCFFLVGNKNHIEPEKIGVVKEMLMAHSVVMRLELEDSKLAEKGQVAVPNIYPDTFRTLLRYVYGHDSTASLPFDEADNLLYVAEKYLMGTLKKKLARRLMSLLTTENICSLLNNPACYTELELKSTITQILRYETDRVLASPTFLGLSQEEFIRILEQDALKVPEIELWREALRWARHNVGSDDGMEIRKQLGQVTKHIRICTFTGEQFCQEVAPTRVLSAEEYMAVTIAIGKQEKQDDLPELCNEITPRGGLENKRKQFDLRLVSQTDISCDPFNYFTFKVGTKKYDIELLPLKCLALNRPKSTPKGSTYEVGCTITITQTAYNNISCTGPAVTVRFSEQVEYGGEFEIPLISKRGNVTLLPNSEYIIRMDFDADQRTYLDYIGRYTTSHLTLFTIDCWHIHIIPITHFAYKAEAE